jgi:hypothetical protein
MQWKLASAGASGTITGKSPLSTRRSYTANYLFEVDNPLQGPAAIIAYFASNGALPWIGSPFAYGTEADAASLCKSIAPDRIAKSNWFTVRVNFEPSEEQSDEKPDEDGNLTDDPLEWREDIDVSFTQISIPVELATFRGHNAGGVNGQAMRVRALGSDGPIVNSAGVPFDPTYEKELDIKVVRFTRNVEEYDGAFANEWISAVNSDQVTIDKPKYKCKDTWGPLTARIKQISASFQMANGVRFWKQTTEVHVSPLGWRKLIVDRGLDRRQMAGDPGTELLADGTPVAISASDIKPGTPNHARIKGPDGYPIAEPVLLDGEGQPLQPDARPVYLEYQDYEEKAFAPLDGVAW